MEADLRLVPLKVSPFILQVVNIRSRFACQQFKNWVALPLLDSVFRLIITLVITGIPLSSPISVLGPNNLGT
jgi:hypothetical protein